MAYDFSKIHERLYVGSQINTVDDFLEIQKAGITHIVDSQSERNDILYKPDSLNIAVLWDGTPDDGIHPKSVDWTQKAIDFSIKALSNPGTIVLTHCAAGRNRGPSHAYGILRCQGFSVLDAVGLLYEKRPQVHIAYRKDVEDALIKLGWVK